MSNIPKRLFFLATVLILPHVALAQSDSLADLISRYNVLYDQGRYAEAASLVAEAIELGREEFGNKDPRYSSLLRDMAELNRAQGHHVVAEKLYLQALAINETALGMEHIDVARILIDLAEIYRLQGRFADAARVYKRALAIDQRVLSGRGTFESGLRDTGLGAAGPKVINSVYDFFDRKNGELSDYGRYTYVLIPGPSPRNAKFMEILLKNTPKGDAIEFDRKKLNIFYIPVREDYQLAARDLTARQNISSRAVAAPITGAYYDHDYAGELLTRLCNIQARETPAVCGSALSQGPYLITLSKSFSDHEVNPGPYLIVDLSGIHPDAFDKFIDAVKVQMKQADFTDLERVSKTRLAALNIILKAADWLTVAKPAVAEIAQLVIPTGKK